MLSEGIMKDTRLLTDACCFLWAEWEKEAEHELIVIQTEKCVSSQSHFITSSKGWVCWHVFMAIGNCFITHLQILISCFQDNQDSEDVHGFIQGQKRGMYRRVAIGHYDPYPWKITLQSPLALNWMQSNYNTASLIRPKRKVSFSKPKPCENFPLSPRVEQTDDPGPKLKTLGNPAWDGLIGMLTQMIWRLVDQPDLTERGNFCIHFCYTEKWMARYTYSLHQHNPSVGIKILL